MSIEDTIGYRENVPSCVVCGKNVGGGRGFARVQHGGIRVDLCCPECMKTFRKNPAPHIARLKKAILYDELKRLSRREDDSA